jgi:hypothetical protein
MFRGDFDGYSEQGFGFSRLELLGLKGAQRDDILEQCQSESERNIRLWKTYTNGEMSNRG